MANKKSEMIDFVRGDGVDAVAEFRAFVTAVGDVASTVLADLVWLHNFGTISDFPAADGRPSVNGGVYRREVQGWVVFYTTNPIPIRITVLYVSRVNPPPHATLEREAVARLARLA
jgi:hypothetical protein